jgi:hypothetical protein
MEKYDPLRDYLMAQPSRVKKLVNLGNSGHHQRAAPAARVERRRLLGEHSEKRLHVSECMVESGMVGARGQKNERVRLRATTRNAPAQD